MNVVGRWIQTPPAHFGEGELRSRESCQGTGNFRVRAAIGLEKYNDNVNQRFSNKRNHYSCATATAGIQRALAAPQQSHAAERRLGNLG